MPILLNRKRINFKRGKSARVYHECVSGECRSNVNKKKDNTQHSYLKTDNFGSMCRKNAFIRLVVVMRCNFAAIYCGFDIAVSLQFEENQCGDISGPKQVSRVSAFFSPWKGNHSENSSSIKFSAYPLCGCFLYNRFIRNLLDENGINHLKAKLFYIYELPLNLIINIWNVSISLQGKTSNRCLLTGINISITWTCETNFMFVIFTIYSITCYEHSSDIY